MISDLLLNFRHLRIQMSNLSAVNIIVGPNNVGKTTLFRGIQKAALDRGTADESYSETKLQIGSPIPAQRSAVLQSGNFPTHITKFWTDTQDKFARSFWTDKDNNIYRHSVDRSYVGAPEQRGILRSAGPLESSRTYYFDLF